MTKDWPLRRIDIRLQHDESGYPPATIETVWAFDMGNGRYQLDNAPFFAVGVSLGDVVEAPITDGRPTFSVVTQRGGHATLRVVVFDADSVADVRSRLAEMGASTELSHLPRLISVDVPPTASLEEIRRALATGEVDGRWSYEEADVPA